MSHDKEPREPIVVIYRDGKHERKLLMVLDEEFGKGEYESPLIYFNSDKVYELRVITPDAVVTIQSMRQKEIIHRTWVTVHSELFPRDGDTNRRLALLGLDITHGEGATLECFGERLDSNFLGSDFEEERKNLEAKSK